MSRRHPFHTRVVCYNRRQGPTSRRSTRKDAAVVQVQTENVLVVPTELFHQLGYFQGFSNQVDRYLPELFDPAHTSYRPRHEVEQDPSFKQLIPYVIFL